MATLTMKVLVVMLAIAAQQVLARSSGSESSDISASSDSSDGTSSEGSENSECRGRIREGKPCQNGTGICTRVGMPGKRYGLMQCVINPIPIGGLISVLDYDNYMDWEHCWTSPAGTYITLTFPSIDIECSACAQNCTSASYCPYDYLSFDENNDDVIELGRLCSYHIMYQYVSSTNYICLNFHSDISCTYGGFSVQATYLYY